MTRNKIVITVCGNAEAGKDTLADMLATMLDDSRRDAYAAPLKQCVHLKTGIPMNVLCGPASVKNDPRFGRYGKSPRQLMREEGEEARQRIGLTVWVDRAIERVLCASERITLISDGRHPQQEVVQLRECLSPDHLVVAVRIVRPDQSLDLTHVSETVIADAPDNLFDLKVVNDGSLDELRDKAEQLAIAIEMWAWDQEPPRCDFHLIEVLR